MAVLGNIFCGMQIPLSSFQQGTNLSSEPLSMSLIDPPVAFCLFNDVINEHIASSFEKPESGAPNFFNSWTKLTDAVVRSHAPSSPAMRKRDDPLVRLEVLPLHLSLARSSDLDNVPGACGSTGCKCVRAVLHG